MKNPLLWLGLGGVGALALALFGSKRSRFLGDNVVLNDTVLVPIAAGSFANAVVPPELLAAVPPGVASLAVSVQKVAPDVVSGPAIGVTLAAAPTTVVGIPNPNPNAVIDVNRSAVTAIRRGGQVMTS